MIPDKAKPRKLHRREVTNYAERRLKLLFLLPFPADLAGSHGGSRAAASIIKLLASRHEVAVLYLQSNDAGAIKEPPPGCSLTTAIPAPAGRNVSRPRWRRLVKLAQLLVKGEPDWVRESWSPEMAAAAAQIAANFQPNIVHFEFNVMAQYIPVVREAAPKAAFIVTQHEPGTLSEDAQGEHFPLRRRLGNWIRRRSWSRYERQMLSQADAVVTFTEKDRRVVDALVADSPVTCIPLRLLTGNTAETEQVAIPSDLLFVGAFRHPPNADAAVRLASSIFPQIRRQLPSASMFLVGADPPEALVRAAPAGLTFTDYVEEVGPYLAGAAIFICPLRLGGGMRVKVLEACAHGKALIASAQAVEGLDLRSDKEFVLARSDEEFAQCAIELLADPMRRSQLGHAAREWAIRSQDPDQWAAEYSALYAQLLMDASHPRNGERS